jgi:RNA polymerase sigma-70 factor (ECF subfamily)
MRGLFDKSKAFVRAGPVASRRDGPNPIGGVTGDLCRPLIASSVPGRTGRHRAWGRFDDGRATESSSSYLSDTTIQDFDQVLRAAVAGEEWAAAVFFHALQPSLLRYLRWEEPAVADDLAGETWLAVAERIKDFKGGEAALRAWVFAVARRRLADHRRRGARRSTRPVPPEQLDGVPGGVDPADLVLEALSAQDAIDQLVAVLSPEQAEVLVLRIVARLSVEEVAQMVDKRPGTVRVIQHRALQRLRAVKDKPATRGA